MNVYFTRRTVDGAELPLVCAGEDFFIQSFSLLELALFQVTRRLENTNIKSQRYTDYTLILQKQKVLHVSHPEIQSKQQQQKYIPM